MSLNMESVFVVKKPPTDPEALYRAIPEDADCRRVTAFRRCQSKERLCLQFPGGDLGFNVDIQAHTIRSIILHVHASPPLATCNAQRSAPSPALRRRDRARANPATQGQQRACKSRLSRR